MCLTIPGRVVRVEGAETPTPTAVVDFEGVSRTLSLLYLPGIRPGEFVLAQAGFAIQRVPPEEARRALEMARRPIELPDRVGRPGPTPPGVDAGAAHRASEGAGR